MGKINSSNRKLHTVSKIRSNLGETSQRRMFAGFVSFFTDSFKNRSKHKNFSERVANRSNIRNSTSSGGRKSTHKLFWQLNLYQFKLISGLILIGLVIIFYSYIFLIAKNYREVSFSDPFKSVFIRPELPYSEVIYKADQGAIDAVETTLIIIESPIESVSSADLSYDNSAESYIDHIYLSTWNRDSTTGLFIAIPGWVYYSSYARGSREYIEVDDMLYISQQVRGDRAYAINEIEKWLGLNIDSYILLDAEARYFTESIFGNTAYTDDPMAFIKSFTSSISRYKLLTQSDRVGNLSVGIHTNLTPIELYNLVSIVNTQVGGKSMATIDLSQDNFLVSNVSSSGNEIKTVSLAEFDKALAQHFRVLRARVVEKEQAKVEVYNSSSISGFAGEVGRKISNRGLRLLRSGNSPNEYQQTTIYVSKLEKYPNSLSVVKEQLDRAIYGQLMATPESYNNGVTNGSAIDVKEFFGREVRVIEGRPEFLTTGDIIVIIGQDVGID